MEGSGFVNGSQNFGFLFRGWFTAPGDTDGPQQDRAAFRDLRFQIVAFLQPGRFPDDKGQGDLRGAAYLTSERSSDIGNPFRTYEFINLQI
jgi:hypothetical protein